MKRVVVALWLAGTVVVWNVVFDRVLIDAGREYVRTAADAARGSGPYARIDASMRPAVPRALVLASTAAGVILAWLPWATLSSVTLVILLPVVLTVLLCGWRMRT